MRLVLILFLSACATASPDMMGASRHEVSVEGIDFVVFHRGAQAQVVRMGYLTRAERRFVPALMQRAAAEASGCRVVPGSMQTALPGDTGVARLDLECL